jgi:hypothetical protein
MQQRKRGINNGKRSDESTSNTITRLTAGVTTSTIIITISVYIIIIIGRYIIIFFMHHDRN